MLSVCLSACPGDSSCLSSSDPYLPPAPERSSERAASDVWSEEDRRTQTCSVCFITPLHSAVRSSCRRRPHTRCSSVAVGAGAGAGGVVAVATASSRCWPSDHVLCAVLLAPSGGAWRRTASCAHHRRDCHGGEHRRSSRRTPVWSDATWRCRGSDSPYSSRSTARLHSTPDALTAS